MSNNGKPDDDFRREFALATGDVMRKELAKVHSKSQTVSVRAPDVYNEVHVPVPNVEVTNDVAVPSVEVTVDMTPVAKAIGQLIAAQRAQNELAAKLLTVLEAQGKLLAQLIEIQAHPPALTINPMIPPATVTVHPPAVTVNSPDVTIQAATRKARRIRIRHDDGTESVVSEE